jgi:DNA-nicking Smr family endonuclease
MVTKKFASFRDAMVGVKPLPKGPQQTFEATPPLAPRPPTPHTRRSPPLVVARDEDRVESLASGADPSVLSNLKRGKYRPQAELDLHGLNAEAAAGAVSRLIQHALGRSCQTLLIIHGRGLHSGPLGPVLRDEIVERLIARHSADVLAFCTAPTRWGGPGALLVQLRRRRTASRRGST